MNVQSTSQTVTQMEKPPTYTEKAVRLTLQMPVKTLKLVLPYLNPSEYAHWLKTERSQIKKKLKSGKDISEAQVEMLNHQMAVSLENLITKFKEQVCQPLKIDPSDAKEIKLFKVRAYKHVISVLENINLWLSATLEKTSAPDQTVDERVKEYDQIIKDLMKKIELLQTDDLTVEIQNSEDKFEETNDDFTGSYDTAEKRVKKNPEDEENDHNASKNQATEPSDSEDTVSGPKDNVAK